MRRATRSFGLSLRIAACIGAMIAGFSLLGADAGLYRLDSARVTRTSEADRSLMSKARVLRIIDGDTISVRIATPRGGLKTKETVRLIGIDAPEKKHGNKPEEPGASEAEIALTLMVSGEDVLLAFDRTLRDVYGRLLAYVFLTDGKCVETLLLETGTVVVLSKYPFALIDEFTNVCAP